MAELTVQNSAAEHHDSGHQSKAESVANQKFAMWLYLASEIVIFSILIAGYIIYRVNQPESVELVHKSLGVALVTANTFILLASSYAMVMGLRAIEMGNKRGFYFWIGLTAFMGVVFLGGQYIEYSELAHLQIALQNTAMSADSELFAELAIGTELTQAQFEELVAATGNFGMRFYAPTAFHGAHVLIGVIWALVVLWKGYKGRYDDNPVGVELFGLYWHFVDVVWIFLFTLIYLI
jgi:heme/copper-type cytochrome/quinol oxidase subunit 3